MLVHANVIYKIDLIKYILSKLIWLNSSVGPTKAYKVFKTIYFSNIRISFQYASTRNRLWA
jgi:hypothetical protein